MFLWSLFQAAIAAPNTCVPIDASDILEIPPPAVIVLGERHGMQPDLRRAERITKGLQRAAPVTIALEAIHQKHQVVLDNFAANKLEPSALESHFDWQNTWGFPYAPYAPLVTAAERDMTVVAAGLDLGKRPEGRTTPIPNGYINILRDAFGEHEMPIELESQFVQSMAWRDFGIAEAAITGWDQKGYLVILTGRGHVEGGKGVQWQAQRMVSVPVHGFTLAWASPPCYPGDRVWKMSLLERLFQSSD